MDSLIYDLTHHLTYRIARLQARLNAQATSLLKTHAQISLSEWRVIAMLANPKVETQKDVLEAMGLDKGQISRTIQRLVQKGMIVPISSAEAQRERGLKLTEKGRHLVERMVPIMMQRQAHLQSGLDEAEIDQLFDFVNRLEQKAGHLDIS